MELDIERREKETFSSRCRRLESLLEERDKQIQELELLLGVGKEQLEEARKNPEKFHNLTSISVESTTTNGHDITTHSEGEENDDGEASTGPSDFNNQVGREGFVLLDHKTLRDMVERLSNAKFCIQEIKQFENILKDKLNSIEGPMEDFIP